MSEGCFITTALSDTECAVTGGRDLPANLVIPDQIRGLTVTTIGKEAFYKNDSLLSVEMPDSVTRIDSRAFEQCTLLEKVYLSNSLQKVGNDAFAHCLSLTAITLPETLEIIDDEGFMDCGFQSISFPASLKTLGKRAFDSNDSLTSLYVPDTITKIEEAAFASCDALQEVYLEDGATLGVSIPDILPCSLLSNAEHGCTDKGYRHHIRRTHTHTTVPRWKWFPAERYSLSVEGRKDSIPTVHPTITTVYTISPHQPPRL